MELSADGKTLTVTYGSKVAFLNPEKYVVYYSQVLLSCDNNHRYLKYVFYYVSLSAFSFLDIFPCSTSEHLPPLTLELHSLLGSSSLKICNALSII